jgi:hypothetical protein
MNYLPELALNHDPPNLSLQVARIIGLFAYFYVGFVLSYYL